MISDLARRIAADNQAATRLIRRAIELYADMLEARGGLATAERLRSNLPQRTADLIEQTEAKKAIDRARKHARALHSDIGRRRANALGAIVDLAADLADGVEDDDLLATLSGLIEDLAEAGRGDGYIHKRVATIDERRRRQTDMPWAAPGAVGRELKEATACG